MGVSLTDAFDPPTGRRLRFAQAAVDVIATSGLRGLTHRAVDAQAGLPQGSCSAYLRTRGALLAAAAQHVGGVLAADVEATRERIGERVDDPAVVGREVVALAVSLVQRPALLVARAELALEAARQPELGAVLARWRESLLLIAEQCVRERPGVDRRMRALIVVAAIEGLTVDALALPSARVVEQVETTVGTLVAALAAYDGDG